MNKKACQFHHARRRAAHRFGINLSPKTHDQLIQDIQTGKALFVEKQSNRISVWDLKYDNQILRLVYDRQRKQIVTILYHDYPGQKPSKIQEAQYFSVEGDGKIKTSGEAYYKKSKEPKKYDWYKRYNGSYLGYDLTMIPPPDI
jgi:hypothetical protein